MPQYNKIELERTARQYGFARDTFEKVLRLRKILQLFNRTELLKSHFLLKGGTAINLTIFDLPRLSVDIDMDFTPNLQPENIIELRKQIKDTLIAHMISEGYTLSETSYFRYTLDSFHFSYFNSGGGRDLIKVELNYSLRAHLFSEDRRMLAEKYFSDAFPVLCVSPIEIFAAKTIALLTRAAARDLYDFVNLVNHNLFEGRRDLFRKSIIFYLSISSDDIDEKFLTSQIDTITPQMIRRDLMPVLRQPERSRQYNLSQNIMIVKDYIRDLMVLNDEEKAYLHYFRNKIYKPELLFTDTAIIDRIKSHPMALWRCQMI